MNDLPDFLLARIAEDEEMARLAGRLGSQWQPGGPGAWAEATTVLASDGALRRSGRGVAEVDDTAAPHVMTWDPARVLAECETKRRIVGWFESVSERVADVPALEPRQNELGMVLRALALPYADHPDYREEWKP